MGCRTAPPLRDGAVKAALGKMIPWLLTSPSLRSVQRALAAVPRRLRGSLAEIHYCHQVDDPYSQLMLQILPTLAATDMIRLTLHAVPPPDDAAAPDRA